MFVWVQVLCVCGGVCAAGGECRDQRVLDMNKLVMGQGRESPGFLH